MGNENVTFCLDSDRRAAIDAIAAGLERDRNSIINEAITLYLELHQWQVEEIHQGIAEANAGDFATPEEVQTEINQMITGRRKSPITASSSCAIANNSISRHRLPTSCTPIGSPAAVCPIGITTAG
jgi:predicted transcriptional regulator